MDFKAAALAIRNRAVGAWPHGVPLRWENDYALLPDAPAAFVHVEIVGLGETIAGYGGGRGANLWRHSGEIVAHVLVPRDTGTQTALGYAEDFAGIFRGARFGGVSCFSAAIEGQGSAADDGNYWRVPVAIAFQFDRVG